MTKELFVEVFNHSLKLMNDFKSNPALLVMDNYKSHLWIAQVDAADDHGVAIVKFPLHCSHLL